jgi:6-phosphogluconolactonase
MPLINRFTDKNELLVGMSQAIEDFVMERLSVQRTVKLALSGAEELAPVYERLAESRKILWSRVVLFLADERYGPLNSKESSFYRISKALVDKTKNLRRFYSYNTKETLSTLVHWYDQMLQQQEKPLFDLVVLSVGEDGRVGGLFPNDSALHEKRRLVAHTRPLDQNGPDWMALTFPALLDSQKIVVMAAGKNRWKDSPPGLDPWPAVGLLGHPDVEVFHIS